MPKWYVTPHNIKSESVSLKLKHSSVLLSAQLWYETEDIRLNHTALFFDSIFQHSRFYLYC